MFTELARTYGRESAAWGNDRTHWNGQVVNKGLLGAFEMLVERQVAGLTIGFIEAKIALGRISIIKPFEQPRPMMQFSGFANQFVTLLKGHSQKGSGGYETSEKDMVQVFAEHASIVADGKDIYLWSRVFNDSFAAGVPKSVQRAGARFLRDAKSWQGVETPRKSELENMDTGAAQWARFLEVAEDQTYVAQVISTKRKERADYCDGVFASLSPEFQALFSEAKFTEDVFDAAFAPEASPELRGTLILDYLRICDAALGVAQGTAGHWHRPGQLSLDVNWSFSRKHSRFQKENPATANAVEFTRTQARDVIDLLFKTRNWRARFVTKPFLNALTQTLSELDQDVLDRIKVSGLYRSIADVLLAPFD
ncbi:MAG: hypothetical protein ACU0BK_15700 [Shimia sp.]|uniref:hypothetical protein n=1 Tax=Shimia sp. TaxID=1954381 RepID=UPI004057FD2C